MPQLAYSVLVSAAVFFVLMTGIDLLFGDTGVTQETLMTNGFRTLIFAMAFAAVKVATLLFKGPTK